ASLDVTSATLLGVTTLKAGSTVATTLTVTDGQLTNIPFGALDHITGNSGSDTLVVVGTAADLSSIAVSSIETLKAGSSAATIFTIGQGDLASGGSIIGSSGADTLVATGTALNLHSTTLSSVEIITATGLTLTDTTFTVDQGDLAAGGSVI